MQHLPLGPNTLDKKMWRGAPQGLRPKGSCSVGKLNSPQGVSRGAYGLLRAYNSPKYIRGKSHRLLITYMNSIITYKTSQTKGKKAQQLEADIQD